MPLIPDPPNATPVPAFDLGAEPPTLPQGSSCLPPTMVYDAPFGPADGSGDWSKTMSYSQAPAADIDPSAPSPEWMVEINALPVAQQEVVLAWWPLIWGKPSEYLEGKYVMSIPALLMHAEAFQAQALKAQRADAKAAVVNKRAARADRKEVDQEYALRYIAWQKDCAARNEWIDGKGAQWKKRVEERKAALLQWDAYVEEARNDYRAAKSTQAPPRPER